MLTPSKTDTADLVESPAGGSSPAAGTDVIPDGEASQPDTLAPGSASAPPYGAQAQEGEEPAEAGSDLSEGAASQPTQEADAAADDGGHEASSADKQDPGSETPPSPGQGIHQKVEKNSGTVIAVQNNYMIQRLQGTPLPEDWIQERLRTYLSNATTDAAIKELLDAHRVAVIHASAGTGRYTTALHVLTRQNVKTIRQVRREPNEKVDLKGITDANTGWILDLTDEQEKPQTTFGADLLEAQEHLRTTGSFVVVVIHTDTWMKTAEGAGRLAHPLRPPAALEVLRAHLTQQPSPVIRAEDWLSAEQIKDRMKSASPEAAAELAQIITAAADLNPAITKPGDFTSLVEDVLRTADNWRKVLLEWHTEHTESAHRNYLLAAAVLDGAPAEVVHKGHNLLGKALGDQLHPTTGHQGPGIIELTYTIGAEMDADDRIRFVRPGYTEAVVDYFWVDRPHHVAAFTGWTAQQAANLPEDLGGPLADRVTAWVTRYTLAKRNFAILRTVATDWASQRLEDRAKDILVAVALDPLVGKHARDLYLAWAKAPDTADPSSQKGTPTPTALKKVLAAALVQLAPAYPQIALKRLAEIAANTKDTTVTNAVGDALTSLWGRSGLQNTTRDILTSWFNASQNHYRVAARRSFLHLACMANTDDVPVLLTSNGAGSDTWNINGWRCALDAEVTPGFQASFNTWMDAALKQPDLYPAVVMTFTEALFRSETDRTYLPERFLRTTHAAYAWAPAGAGELPPSTPAFVMTSSWP